MNANQDDNSKSLTEFDLIRLDELEEDGEMETESKYYKIFHYGKSLVLVGQKGEFKEFKNKNILIAYLSK